MTNYVAAVELAGAQAPVSNLVTLVCIRRREEQQHRLGMWG